MILVIDNYDSFTYNLVQYLGELGAEVVVERNDAVSVDDIRELAPSGVLISPGPGRPEEAGVSLEVIAKLGAEMPIFGVCLGHQSIAQHFGASVVRADRLMHGRTSEILHRGPGGVRELAEPAHGDAIPLVDREARYDSRRARDHGLDRPRRSDGASAPPASHRGRSVPSRVLSDRAWPRPDSQLAVLIFGGHGVVISDAIKELVAGRDLSAGDVEAAMDTILAGKASGAQIAAFVVALRMKGESADEIAAAARALRKHCETIRPKVDGPLLDTCGTGGDGLHTFNISTAAASWRRRAGLPSQSTAIARFHRKRGAPTCWKRSAYASTSRRSELGSASSKWGSAFCSRRVTTPRCDTRRPYDGSSGFARSSTCSGRLSNPASATHQVVGSTIRVGSSSWLEALGSLGLTAAWVVHGEGGLDEVSPSGPTTVAELRDGQVSTFEVTPDDFGLSDGADRGTARRRRHAQRGDHSRRAWRRAGAGARRRSAERGGGSLRCRGRRDPRAAAARAAEAVDSGAAYGNARALGAVHARLMTDYLSAILARKRRENVRRRRHLAAMQPVDRVRQPERSERGTRALRRAPGEPPSVIAEVKFRSPSAGEIRPGRPG